MTQVSVGHAWLNLRDSLESAATAWYLAELADRSLEERHAAEPLYTLLQRAYELLDAGMAPGRVARWYEMHLADELGVRPEVDRCVECDRVLEADERFRWVPPLGGVLCERCPGPPHDRTAAQPRRAQAAQGLPAPGHRGARRRSGWPPATEREVEAAMRDFVRHALERDARSLAFLDEVRHEPAGRRRGGRTLATRRGAAVDLMPTVHLRDIVTEDDVEAVMGLRRAPGQERFLGSMISHFEDAIADARACPRMWSVHDAGDGTLVGFAMISDDIPQATLDAEPDIVGPYFLWRLLIDRRFQGRGYGRATLDAVVDYVRGRPGGDGPVYELRGR